MIMSLQSQLYLQWTLESLIQLNMDHSNYRCYTTCLILAISMQTYSSPRRPLFLHALSFQCTSNLCINFLKQFSVYFHIQIVQYANLVIELCSALKIFQNMLQLFSKSTRDFVAIELLTFCKNVRFHFYSSKELSVFWINELYTLSRKWSIKNYFYNSSKLIY